VGNSHKVLDRLRRLTDHFGDVDKQGNVIKTALKRNYVDWIHMAQNRDQW
jgi:hypothetical protein